MSTRQRDASGRFAKSGGQSLGTATATILMVADKFADGARVVQKTSADAGKSVDGMSAAFGRAKKAASDFDNSKLGKVQEQIKAVRDSLALVSAAAAGVTLFGVKAAQDVNRTRTSIELLTGSVGKADKVFADVRKLTDKFHVPFDEAIKGAQAFLPLANSTGIAVEDLVKSAIRFQAYNPRKSFDDIKFSINEALSGDFVSIKDALDLSRKQRDDLKKAFETQGPQALLEGLNTILEERGFDDKTLEKLGESGANAFEIIKSEIKETMAVAFTPLLKDVVLPTIKAFGNFIRNLRETSPDLLKFAGGVTAIVAAGAPLLAFLASAITAYKTLKTASAGLNLGGTLGKVAKGGLAVAGGIALGTTVATGLANAGVQGGDLQRIRDGESASDILGERIKQLVVILTDAFISIAEGIAKAGVFLFNAIDQLANVFRLGGAIIGEIFGNLRRSVGLVIEGLGKFIDSVAGRFTVEGLKVQNAGLNEQKAGQEQALASAKERDRLVSELTRGFSPKPEDIAAVESTFRDLRSSVLGGLIGMLFPVEQAVQETASSVEDSANDIKKAMGDSEEYLQQQAQDIASTTKQYNEDIKGLETKKQQDIIELNKKFADEQIEIARERVKAETEALADLNNDLRKLNTDLTRETEKEGRDRARKNIEMQIEFQRDEVADAQSHLEKLQKIKVDAAKKEQDFVENFDFASLFDLSEQVVQQTNEANEEYDKQRQERVQALQYEREDLVREFGAQREERLIQYDQDRADRQAQYEQERARIVTESAEKLMLAQQAHANDLTQLQTKFVSEQQLRQQAYAAELQLLMQSEAARAQVIAQAQEALLQQAYSFMNRARPQPQPQNAGSGNGALSPSAVKAYNESIQRQRDRHRQAEQSGTRTPGVNGNESGRAFGGPVLGGRTYPVNEPRAGFGAEDFVRGTRSIPLPDGEGLFTPTRSGQIKPNPIGNGTPQLNVTVALNSPIDSGILTMDKAVALIQRAAEEGAQNVLNEWMASYAR
jgi:hypothetical protein